MTINSPLMSHLVDTYTPAPPPPAPGAKLPNCAGMKALRESGWTHADIQLEYGVSNQSVARKYRDCGLSEPRFDYQGLIPWRAAPAWYHTNTHRMLKQAARLKLNDPTLKLSATRMRELIQWITKLEREGLVVDYDDETGYRLVPKREGVDDWYVRRPD